MKKLFCHKNLVYNMTVGSSRILESTFTHLEVPENLKSGPFSRTLTSGQTSATILGYPDEFLRFQEIWNIPKFLFGNESTSGLDTWLGLTQRVTHKILGIIPPREHELLIFEVPHYEPMGESATGEDMLTLQRQRQLWKFGIREKYFDFWKWG